MASTAPRNLGWLVRARYQFAFERWGQVALSHGAHRVSRSHFLDGSPERARLILAQTAPRPQRPAVPNGFPEGHCCGWARQHCQGWSHSYDHRYCRPPLPPTQTPLLLLGHQKPPLANPLVHQPVRRRLRLGPSTRTLTQMDRREAPEPKPKHEPAPRPRYHPYHRCHPDPTAIPLQPHRPYLNRLPRGLLLPPPPSCVVRPCANYSLCINFLLHFLISQLPMHLCTTRGHGPDPLLVVLSELTAGYDISGASTHRFLAKPTHILDRAPACLDSGFEARDVFNLGFGAVEAPPKEFPCAHPFVLHLLNGITSDVWSHEIVVDGTAFYVRGSLTCMEAFLLVSRIPSTHT